MHDLHLTSPGHSISKLIVPNEREYVTFYPLIIISLVVSASVPRFGLVYWGLTPQQPGSYQGGEMMMMKSKLEPSYSPLKYALPQFDLSRSFCSKTMTPNETSYMTSYTWIMPYHAQFSRYRLKQCYHGGQNRTAQEGIKFKPSNTYPTQIMRLI